jgi:hypothetical protein
MSGQELQLLEFNIRFQHWISIISPTNHPIKPSTFKWVGEEQQSKNKRLTLLRCLRRGP